MKINIILLSLYGTTFTSTTKQNNIYVWNKTLHLTFMEMVVLYSKHPSYLTTINYIIGGFILLKLLVVTAFTNMEKCSFLTFICSVKHCVLLNNVTKKLSN